MNAIAALEGLERRLAEGIAQVREYGLPEQASVTVNRLVGYDELPDTLRRLGFDDVAFSYPRVEPFGSTSLVYGEHSHSSISTAMNCSRPSTRSGGCERNFRC